jgi:hypothetical protein
MRISIGLCALFARNTVVCKSSWIFFFACVVTSLGLRLSYFWHGLELHKFCY